MRAPARNLAWLARHHFGTLWWSSFVLCSMPGGWLAVESLTGSLGINPLDRLLRVSGLWALILLLVTLGVTPVRRASVWIAQQLHSRYGKRVSDWNWLVRLRRQFGLFAFFYAAVHLLIYVGLDVGPDAAAFVDDAAERPFVLLGVAAFVLLVPLAATSNQASIHRLGRGWRRLHSISYPIAVLGVWHFWLQMKLGEAGRPLPYALVLTVLLGARVLAALRGERGKVAVSAADAMSGMAAPGPSRSFIADRRKEPAPLD